MPPPASIGVRPITAPQSTKSTSRPPQREHTRRRCHSGIGVSAPYGRASSAGSGSAWCRQSRHQTIIRAWAAAVLLSVAGGPGWDFIPSSAACLPQALGYRRPPSILASLGTAARTGARRRLARRIAYNPCRNRHCPKCQGAAARDCLAAREGHTALVEADQPAVRNGDAGCSGRDRRPNREESPDALDDE
jgi:hypothetical protein